MYLENWLLAGLVAFLLATFGVIGSAIYDEYTSDKFYLRKASWTCTESHVETIITTQSYDGKTFYPVVNTIVVCDQWTRKK